MKGDFSRRTFDAKKHYAAVEMQQGRVQLDADWNEELDILGHRIETEALDVIGLSGGPMHDAGFALSSAASGDFKISKGRYYVDGILCENDDEVSFTSQPDFPGVTPINDDGGYLVYIDVWQRHLTALDDAAIRETALGGPDTATRLKTVWQVKVGTTTKSTCQAALHDLIPPPSGALNARETPAQTSSDPCLVPPGSGYKGLENQLYRVEIHTSGPAATTLLPGAAGVVEASKTGAPNEITLASSPGPAWTAGDWVEIFTAEAPERRQAHRIAAIAGLVLTLSGSVRGIAAATKMYVHKVDAIYKWSRDNGCVVTAIEKIEGNEITASDLGRDDVLGFAPNQCVEILDDRAELAGRKTELHEIASIDRASRKITLKTTPTPLHTAIPGVNSALHPKLRRWDGVGAVQSSADPTKGWLDLESGVQVRFASQGYYAHDYWIIPARAATADAMKGRIEWPKDTANQSIPQAPLGVQHHYAALARITKTGAAITLDADCRKLFPPITELTSFFFLGGDGQEVMPVLSAPTTPVPLPKSIRVGVANGEHPVLGAKVLFEKDISDDVLSVETGTLLAQTGTTATVLTDANGVAAVAWKLRPDKGQVHSVTATLLDEANSPVHLPIRFSANLSVATEVAFYPSAKCPVLSSVYTVQEAIEALAHKELLTYAGGDGQEAMPSRPLPKPLRARLSSLCEAASARKVRFKVVDAGGKLATTIGGIATGTSFIDVPTQLVSGTPDEAGQLVAECYWMLDPAPGASDTQSVFAVALDQAGQPVGQGIWFYGRRSVAAQVAYTPPKDCETLKDAQTVQQAIDLLCERGGACCEIVLRPEMSFETIWRKLHSALTEGDVKACFAPGTYRFPRTLALSGRGRRLTLSGAGEGSRIEWEEERSARAEATLALLHLDSVVVRDLYVEGIFAASPNPGTPRPDDPFEELGGAITFDGCADVLVENVRVRCAAARQRSAACITVQSASDKDKKVPGHVRIAGCRLEPGPGQIGALVVNAARAVVEDNIVSVSDAEVEDYRFRIENDDQFRHIVRDVLLRRLSFDDPGAPPVYKEGAVRKQLRRLTPDRDGSTAAPDQVIPEIVQIHALERPLVRDGVVIGPPMRVTFQTPRALAAIDDEKVSFLEKLFLEAGGAELDPRTPRAVTHMLMAVMDRAIVDAMSGRRRWRGLIEWLSRASLEYRPPAGQGIVIGGQAAVDARISNNTVTGALQGIHVGWSRRGGRSRHARRVVVTGNTIDVPLGAEDTRERHGIFVGNSENIVVEHNVVRVQRRGLALFLPIEGIRVYGKFGPFLMVRENHIEGATTGILVHAVNARHNEMPPGGPYLWRVGDNVAVDAKVGAVTYPSSGMVLDEHPNLP